MECYGAAVSTVAGLAVGETATLGEPRLAPAARRRLAELGLRPGERVRLAQRSVGGVRVLEVECMRIAVDAATAACLPVESDP